MEKKNVRVPKQKRSIAKKEQIIEAARRVFNRDGFFGATTDEIAKEAGVSVGSIYSYFTDKKDILLACCHLFGKGLTEDICEEIGNLSDTGDIQETVRRTIEILTKSHSGQSLLYHDEVMSLRYRDDDVKKYFIDIQETMMDAVTNAMESKGYAFQYPEEQTFLLFQMLDSIVDELVFGQKSNINHDILIRQCIQLIVSMLTKKENP